ncbi:ABC transporter permease [Thermoanaerobacter kivui]|nr:ABC transporter permease [Thermoanaerobacter kivui]
MKELLKFYPIFWREMICWKKRFRKILAGNIVSPLLFLTTFGLGLGKNMSVSGTNYLDFVLPGIIALSSLSNSYNSIAADLNIRRTIFKTFDQYVLAPIKISSVVLGEVLAGALQGMTSCLILLVLGLLFGAHINLTPVFFVVLIASCFTFASLGVVAAMVANSHGDMANFGTFFILPMTFLGGTFFSVDSMPLIVKVFIWMLPLTPISYSLRSIALNREFSPFIIAVVFFWAAIMYLLAVSAAYKKSAD